MDIKYAIKEKVFPEKKFLRKQKRSGHLIIYSYKGLI
jgi:hypothetical protein